MTNTKFKAISSEKRLFVSGWIQPDTARLAGHFLVSVDGRSLGELEVGWMQRNSGGIPDDRSLRDFIFRGDSIAIDLEIALSATEPPLVLLVRRDGKQTYELKAWKFHSELYMLGEIRGEANYACLPCAFVQQGREICHGELQEISIVGNRWRALVHAALHCQRALLDSLSHGPVEVESEMERQA